MGGVFFVPPRLEGELLRVARHRHNQGALFSIVASFPRTHPTSRRQLWVNSTWPSKQTGGKSKCPTRSRMTTGSLRVLLATKSLRIFVLSFEEPASDEELPAPSGVRNSAPPPRALHGKTSRGELEAVRLPVSVTFA